MPIDPSDSNVPLHTIQEFVTGDKREYGTGRMRVPGGWIYWLAPHGAGSIVSSFVPVPPQS